MRIAVVCWDLGHNAFGRAHLLADMLSAKHEVEIVGSHFPEFGGDVWLPLRQAVATDGTGPVTPALTGPLGPGIRVRSFPGTRFPEYFATMEQMAAGIDADVVYAVKARWPALGVGLLAKHAGGRPLVVDCDDLELSFVAADRGMTLGELTAHEGHPGLRRPEGKVWTRFADGAVAMADAVTVASAPLAARYRGSVIPHARDERVFDPDLYDREAARACLGLGPDDRAVLFAGTARRHKGIDRIAAALEQIGDPRNRLLVPITPELAEVMPLLAGLERWVQPVVRPLFSALPQLLAAGDLVCVLQDQTSESAQWQMPAKITDALAMGVPCLATPTPPVLPLIDEGAVREVDDEGLPAQLAHLLRDDPARAVLATKGREVFLRRFSYAAVAPRLERVMADAARNGSLPSSDLASLVDFQRAHFGVGHRGAPPGADARADEVARVHQSVESVLADDHGPVAVVSRGDDDLIRFERHVGWHFPQNGDGGYAGYHPADSDAAIGELEDVRRRGARYLLIPDSASWWLDHYVGFRDHLERTYPALDAGDGVTALVALHPRSPGGSR